MSPRVSVVIPTFNRRALVLEAIASVRAQAHGDLEILVCDDGSTDGTADAVRELAQLDARVHLLEGAHSGYPGTVRNRGIAAAAGEWVAFLDSDDLWLEQKLEKQLGIADADAKAQFIYSYAAMQLPGGGTRRIMAHAVRRQGRMLETLLRYSVVPTSSVLVKRATLDRVGGFDEQLRLVIAEDYELYLRVAHQSEFHFVPENLVLYRPQRDGLTADVFREIDYAEIVVKHAIKRFDIRAPLADEALSRLHLRRYKHHLLRGFARDIRLADLESALQDDPRSALARSLLLAEKLRCAPLVKALV